MSDIQRPISTSCVGCPPSNVRSRLPALDVPHPTSDPDFLRWMSHIQRPIPTSCVGCPTSYIRFRLPALDVPHPTSDSDFLRFVAGSYETHRGDARNNRDARS